MKKTALVKSCVLISLCAITVSCSDPDLSLPHPPIALPFDAQYAGESIEFEFEIERAWRYGFKLRFLFEEDDVAERAYLNDLIRKGRASEKTGLEIGLSIPLHLILEKQQPDGSYKVLVDRQIDEQGLVSGNMSRFSKEILMIDLELGWHRVKITSLATLDNPQRFNIALGLHRSVRK